MRYQGYCNRELDFFPINNFVHRFQHAVAVHNMHAVHVYLRSLVYYSHCASLLVLFRSSIFFNLIISQFIFFLIFRLVAFGFLFVGLVPALFLPSNLNHLFECFKIFYNTVAFSALIYLCCFFVIFFNLGIVCFFFDLKLYSAQMISAYNYTCCFCCF